ncbi:hypothetical protein [Neptunomonas qingdaonensis]|uniref:Uncharacterized protein n=1 Tax=Neptunomonas qingdaonensis TaxID=1045558 RepID=A0A1I2SE93_9GAMM|nr:hypothetical protein [Neptunomonas qingdaonensis]SFG48351.1 hypothetical protein SAMN05216175_107133 [Neptunomonas qingdaonensis]
MKIQHLLTLASLTTVTLATATLATTLLSSATSFAGGSDNSDIHSKPSTSQNIDPTFDIIHTRVTTQNNIATFHMAVASQAGTSKPSASGKLAGSSVYSYVWPTSLDSASVGFESDAGILTLAVTAHPDFDDTPLYDENADNDPGNDGDVWHSHWVVLQPNQQCGKGALGVVDIPEGTTPRLPKTWPGLPILLDSPGWDPVFNGDTVKVQVAFDDIKTFEKTTFDGVTAGLRVNQSVHAPLLCVVNVIDIASGDLSLPGRISQ